MYEATIGPAYDKSSLRLQWRQLGLHMRKALGTWVPYAQSTSGVTSAQLRVEVVYGLCAITWLSPTE